MKASLVKHRTVYQIPLQNYFQCDTMMENKRIKHVAFEQGGDPVNSFSYHSL